MSLPLDNLDLLAAPELVQAGAPLQLPVESIDEDPDQPRQEFDPGALQELAESIALRGVLQAISVRPHPQQSQRWMVNFGARRLRASRMAGKPVIPAYVDSGADSYDQVIENEQREGLKPLDLALFVQRQMALGATQTEIARRLGKSQPYVAYACALIDAPDWLMDLYRQGRCQGMTELYHLRRLHAQAPGIVREWVEQRSGITRTDIHALKVQLASTAADLGGQHDGAIDGPERGASSVVAHPTLATAPAPSRSPAFAPPSEPVPEQAPRSPAARSGVARLALFARKGEHIVEIVLGEAPDAPGEVFVRHQGDVATLRVSAVALELIGFERIPLA